MTQEATETTKHLIVHGHFYQPPREDPFTGKVPREPGAEPYHDFNEKIDDECYRPNAELGNFGRISFDVGPTLAAWLRKHDAPTYHQIIAADHEHYREFGYGNALAQAYNHTILPLSIPRDRRIQIAWGIADFKHRYGHNPEGMWLGEAAVDAITLSLLAQDGIKFVILAPWQAASPVDTTEPYMVRLRGGRSISVFFFDAPLSSAVSFDDKATLNADYFAANLLRGRVNRDKERANDPQMLLIATDGEVYGHHKRFRDKFLSYLLTVSAPRDGYEVVSLARYLHEHPPQKEVLIEDDTSWSCHHGIKRWHGWCDCIVGSGTWKWYLRRALNKLAVRIDRLYVDNASILLADPWKTIEDYVAVKFGTVSRGAFIRDHRAAGAMSDGHLLGKMIEAEYYRHLMFTSCGFFFEDLDRIEPRNNIAFAAKAIDLMREADPNGTLEAEFVAELSGARSWRTGVTGAEIYEQVIGKRRERTIDAIHTDQNRVGLPPPMPAPIIGSAV